MSAPKKVFFTTHLPYAIEKLRALAKPGSIEIFSYEQHGIIPRKELVKQVKGMDGIFCLLQNKMDQELIDQAGPQLKTISTMSVGFNHIDLDTCREKQIHVGHTPGVLDVSTAETAVALTFAAKRRVEECIDSAKTGQWKSWHPFEYLGTDITSSTVGVVGLGRIGATYAKMLKFGFNCRILYCGHGEKPEFADAINAEFVSFEQLLQESDIVSIHCPLTPETTKMFGPKQFELMKKDAVLVNTGRGAIVDQDALYEALKSKEIAAAGLDVTDPEPLPEGHKLYGLDNCTIIPHVGSATHKTREAMADIAVNNLYAGLFDQTLPHSVL